jgi:uncharacterized MAPEG superfamily protein
MTALPIELQCLVGGVVLLLFHVFAQSQTMTREKGVAFNAGARDDATPVKGAVAQRMERASKNFQETFPAFIAMALALVVTNKTGGVGALVWLVARVVYIPLYAFGVPYIRSLVWLASIVGIIMMAARLVA